MTESAETSQRRQKFGSGLPLPSVALLVVLAKCRKCPHILTYPTGKLHICTFIHDEHMLRYLIVGCA